MQVYDHSPPIFPLRFNPQLLDRAYQCAYGVAAWGAEDRINKPRHRSTERASQEDAKDEDRLHATVPPPPLPPQPTSAVLCPTSIGFSAWLSGFAETFARTLFTHRVLWRHPDNSHATPLLRQKLRRLPWRRRFLAKAIRGPEPGAHVLEPLPLTRIFGSPPDVSLPSLLSFFVFLYLSVCEASKLRSLPFTHPIYVASRYFQ